MSARATSRPSARARISFRTNPITSASIRRGLAWRASSISCSALASGKYAGAIWTQGSPRIEETIYWLNLLLDYHAADLRQRRAASARHVSNDGPKNLIDFSRLHHSRVWADDSGRNRTGLVLIQEQQIFAARDVQKGDARPGGYVDDRRPWRHPRRASAMTGRRA